MPNHDLAVITPEIGNWSAQLKCNWDLNYKRMMKYNTPFYLCLRNSFSSGPLKGKRMDFWYKSTKLFQIPAKDHRGGEPTMCPKCDMKSRHSCRKQKCSATMENHGHKGDWLPPRPEGPQP